MRGGSGAIGGFVRMADGLTMAAAMAALAMILLTVLTVNHMIVVRVLGGAIVWHIELSIYLSVGALFLGSPYALKTKGHVAVDLLENAVSARPSAMVQIAIHGVVLAVVLYLAVASAGFAWEAYAQGVTSTSLWSPPLWPAYAAMPLGLVLTAVQGMAEILVLSRVAFGAGSVR